MNDFLKNLRSSHKKDHPQSKKKSDGQFYVQQDRRNVQDRRGYQTPPQETQTPPPPPELMPELLENLTRVTELFEKFVNASELHMAASIRQKNAVSNLIENLNQAMEEGAFIREGPPRVTTSYASGTHYTKDDILEMIQNLRDQGATFSTIAEYLTEKGIPTFSGRGTWHAQTIHRLCK
ncbi:MAG: hypothetical protein MI749_10640 [Desulfovibrionales bacterium]|nr:hypothetical protein [Desulfovibrionales bacterium]